MAGSRAPGPPAARARSLPMNPFDSTFRAISSTVPLTRARPEAAPLAAPGPVGQSRGRITVRRRRRVLLRLAPVVALVLALLFVAVDRLRGPEELTADEVAVQIHDQVTREVIARTDDFSTKLGPLDCVELGPSRGSCLATVSLADHQTDRVMVAVAYEAGPGGDLKLAIKLP